MHLLSTEGADIHCQRVHCQHHTRLLVSLRVIVLVEGTDIHSLFRLGKVGATGLNITYGTRNKALKVSGSTMARQK